MNAPNNPADPHTANEAPPQLDAEAVRRLRELDPEGKHGVVTRVLQTYETSLQRALLQLEDARRAADASALGKLAHTLKASSAAVGALVLSERCAATEKAVRDGTVENLNDHVDGISHETTKALVAVRAMLRAEGLTSR